MIHDFNLGQFLGAVGSLGLCVAWGIVSLIIKRRR